MSEHWDWYRVFYAAAKSGSLSKAAEELFISQPAVTYTIKQLEERLGGQLFFRTSKGVKLTAEGQVLFTYVEQAFNFMETGEKKIAEMHQLLAGEIRIGAGDTLCKHFLLPHLARFHAAYPNIKIQVTNRTTPETIQLLKEGTIDFGVVHLPVHDAKLHSFACMEIEDCFIVGEAYRHLAERLLSLEELSRFPLLLLEQGSSTRKAIDRFAAELGLSLQPEIELGSIDLLIDFAKAGFGAACVVKNFIAEEISSSEVYEIQLKERIPPRTIGIITLKHVPLSAASKQFIDSLPRISSPTEPL